MAIEHATQRIGLGWRAAAPGAGRFHLVSAGIHGTLLALALALPPTGLLLGWTDDGQRTDARMLSASRLPPRPVVVPDFPTNGLAMRRPTGPGVAPSSEVGFVRRHRGREGKMGAPDAPHRHRRHAILGAAERRAARELGREQAQVSGLLGLLTARPGRQLASILGSESAVGGDATEALGELDGKLVGSAFGLGGLGATGVRPGGGGAGGLIGVGYGACGCGEGRFLGLRCRGRGMASGGVEKLTRERGPRSPKARLHVQVGRSDDAESSRARRAVRRAIQSRLSEVRYCYETRLKEVPSLRGKLVVRFSVLPMGALAGATVESSTVGDGPLAACVLRAARRWSFPAPGAPLEVSYPFLFRIAGDS